MDQQQHIENEVQRRIARITHQHHQEVDDLKARIREMQGGLTKQLAIIQRLTAEPLYFGTLLRKHNTPDPTLFKVNDAIVVVDPDSEHFSQAGRIVSSDPVVTDEGVVTVELEDANQTVTTFAIGTHGAAQIRLAQKADGTFAVISVDGKPWEVQGIPDLSLDVGEPVKIKADTKQIISRGYDMAAGPICRVLAITEKGVEIEEKGEKRLVVNAKSLPIEEGDRVVVDSGFFIVIEKLERDSRQRYKLTSDLGVTWDEIGGLENAKHQCRQAIELPFKHKDLFAHYKMKKDCGVLLYGPPGCGKTLLAKAAAGAVARLHGKSAVDTGYIYVKSPEILDKWVGNTEAEIRELFERGRRHYRQHGYPAILAFDEFDAIAPQRGTRRSSDVADTIVPMFLGEMDGIDENQTRENPILFVMTNRADILDPAITRPGRISRHIKIERPNADNALDILRIHSDQVPFFKDDTRMTILAVACQDIFSKTRLLYRVNNEHDFTLGDTVNGAMLAAIVQDAKTFAIERDIEANTQTGVIMEDFREAVKKCFREQRGMNHSYDLQDFAEKLGIQPKDMQIERCFGAA
jgi:proteasome-associated ATPase